jgi:ABC-type sugar transport system substrate-binding protein
MKKICLFLVAACMSILAALPASAATAKFHIGMVTSTVSQGEDVLRGAEYLLKAYGDAAKGGMIKHITYPDNFMSEMETTIAQIVGLADDPKMKAIVVSEAVPGTTEAFRRIREKHPNMLLFAGNPQEDPNVIAGAASLAVNQDMISMGYIMVAAAKKMGANTYVHISFPRHMSYELLSRRRNILEQACKDLGLKFAFETAPDPTSDVGVAGAQQFILEKVPQWLQKYGKKAAFFSTNDAQVEPLLKRIADLGGFYVQTDSPLQGYQGAFGLDLSKEKGNWPAILKTIEKAVDARGAKGRLATWPYPSGYCITAALGEYAKRILEGKARLGNFRNLMGAFDAITPGVAWSGGTYTDVATGAKLRNFILVYQDTYVLGKGPLGMTKSPVPEKYYRIK